MLARKLIRTLGRYKAQFISMVLMIALGVGVFLGFNIEWYSLEKNTSGIYEATGFADYRIYAEPASSPEDLDAVKAIEGVEDATRYLSVNTAAGEEGEEDSWAVFSPGEQRTMRSGGVELRFRLLELLRSLRRVFSS